MFHFKANIYQKMNCFGTFFSYGFIQIGRCFQERWLLLQLIRFLSSKINIQGTSPSQKARCSWISFFSNEAKSIWIQAICDVLCQYLRGIEFNNPSHARQENKRGKNSRLFVFKQTLCWRKKPYYVKTWYF